MVITPMATGTILCATVAYRLGSFSGILESKEWCNFIRIKYSHWSSKYAVFSPAGLGMVPPRERDKADGLFPTGTMNQH